MRNTVQRITAKIIFLAGILIQGVETVKANQSVQVEVPVSDSISLTKDWANHPAFNQLANLANTIELKGSRRKAKKSQSSSVKESLNKTERESLQYRHSLSLPTNPEEVKITNLKPLTLADIEALVEMNNPSLKAMERRIDQSKSLLLASISRWYPTINLTANGLPEYLTIEQTRNPDFGSNSSGRQWRTSLALQVQWKLIDPARVPEIAAARDAYEQARDSYLVTLRDLRLQAVSQYFLLQRADEGVRIGKQSMRASLISLRDAKARFEAGVATRLEVLEAETQLARDKQLLTSKLGDQKITRRELASMLNLTPEITPTAASAAQVIGLWKASLQESIVAAYSFREELDKLLLDVSISNSNANSALAATQPILSLVNTLSYSRLQGQTGIGSNLDVDMDDYSRSLSNTVGLNMTWSIFDGGRSKALYRYNKQKAKEAEDVFASTRSLIRKEVEQSFFKLKTANQDIATTTREVIASRESLRLARLRFQAGVTTQREVVNNQRDLTQAEVRYSDAITTYNTSLAQLRRRTGIDHIEACDSVKMSPNKVEEDDMINVPIEPFPLIPACKASTISNKK